MTNLISKIWRGAALTLAAAAVAAGLSACSDEPLGTAAEEAERGLPCSVTLKVELPPQGDVAVSRASQDVENRIENIALFFFPDVSDRPVVYSQELATPWLPSSASGPGSFMTVTIGENDLKGLTSGKWWVYAVANLGKTQGGTTLDVLRSKDRTQFLGYCTNAAPALDIVATAVLMSGQYTSTTPAQNADGSITLQAGANQLSGHITLKRVMAKHTLTFKNGTGVTFVPTSYTLYNSSTSETLMERDGWTSDGTTVSASGTYAGEQMQRMAVQDEATLVDLNGVIPTQLGGNYSIEFYTRENVQHPKTVTPAADWTNYHNREAATEAERNHPQRRQFTYAPDHATYIVVRGHYRGPGQTNQQTHETPQADGDVEYTIHLGDFGDSIAHRYDNFSIRRNFHYTYDITINGVNSIIAEAQADNGQGAQPGAEGSLMSPTDNMVRLDAHYETVLLKIDKGRLTDYAYSVSTPYTSKTIVHGQHAQQGLPTAFDPDDDYRWVEFARPALHQPGNVFSLDVPFESYSTLKRADYAAGLLGTDAASENNPQRRLYHLPKLLEYLGDPSLTAQTNDHFVVEGDYIYVVAYVEEFYYTNRPDNGQPASLSEFVNATDRTMGMATNTWISEDHHSIYSENPVFQISQRSIKTGFSLDVPNPLGVETYEETKPMPIAANGAEPDPFTEDEQWGWANFYSHFDLHPNGGQPASTRHAQWDNYIDEGVFGWIPGADGKYQFRENDTPLYGLYQAISRNRDLDGNGLIDADEVRWYLPSHTQCLALWYVNNSLPTEAQFRRKTEADVGYYSSTGRNNRLYLTSSNSASDRVWFVDEGVSFNGWQNWWGQGGTANVRAVRSLGRGFYNRRTTIASRWDQASRTITVTNLSAEATRTGARQRGNYRVHHQNEEPDKLPEAFQVARSPIQVQGGGESVATEVFIGQDYFELSDTTDRGQWRVPNEKELGLMVMYLGNQMDGAGCRTTYYGGNNDNPNPQTHYYQISGTRITIQGAGVNKVWLVRDVEPIGTPEYDSEYGDGGSAFGQPGN